MARQVTIKTESIDKALRDNFGYVYIAAQALRCSAKTIYRRISQTKSLQNTLDEVRGIELDQTELMLHYAIMQGEAWAIRFKLGMQGADRGYVQRKELTGVDNEPITFVIKRAKDEDGKDV